MVDDNTQKSAWELAPTLVDTNLTNMNNRADSGIATANALIQQLANLQFNLSSQPPKYEPTDIGTGPPTDPTKPADPPWESDSFTEPSWDTVDYDPSGYLASANPWTDAISQAQSLPLPHKGLGNVAGPTTDSYGPKPTKDPVQYSTPIPFVPPELPDPPGYLTITIPDPDISPLAPFTPGAISTFDEAAPTFDATRPDLGIDYQEVAYDSVLLEAIKAKLLTMLQTGLWLDDATTQAMYDRARAREDINATKAYNEVLTSFASKGFSQPSGVLAKELAAARETNQLALSNINRELMIKEMESRLEAVKLALAQGVDLEKALLQAHDSMLRRTLEAQKAQLDAAVQTYNMFVAEYDVKAKIFNTRMLAWEAETKYEIQRIEARKAEVEAYKAEWGGYEAHARAEASKADVNASMAKAYEAEIRAAMETVSIQKANADIEVANAQIVTANLNTYRADLEAWGEDIKRSYRDFTRYELEMKGEVAAHDANKAYTAMFADTVQAYTATMNAKTHMVSARIEAIKAESDKFRAKVEGEVARLRTVLDKNSSMAEEFKAKAQMYSTDMGKWQVQLQEEYKARVDETRNALSYWETQVKEYDAQQSRLIEVARLQSDAIKAAGQSATQLAAGAMSAINVGATISASGSSSSSSTSSRSCGKTQHWSVNLLPDEVSAIPTECGGFTW